MKKLIFSLLIFSAVSFSFGFGGPDDIIIGPFSGLNNTDNSAAIPNDKAQDLLNVDLSLGGKSVKKRKGFGLAYTLTKSTSPVHGVYEFYDSGGNDISLAFNDTYLTAVTNGGSTTILFSTGTNGATWQCIDSQGFAYCVSTNRDPIIKTNGATYSQLVSSATGKIITVTPDRLVLSGFSSFPNRIDFSAAANFADWSTGISPTSAFNFTISAPGSKITHLAYAFNRVMWFKDSSFGYILQGATASDWVVQTISPNVGTLDNSSVYYQGILYFRGNDGHIWSYDGSNLTKLTRDINGTVSQSQGRISNSWLQSSSDDFAAGNTNPSIYLDTQTTSGSLSLTFPDGFSVFRDGSNGTKKVWTSFNSGVAGGTVSVSGNQLLIQNSGTTAATSVLTSNLLGSFLGGTTYHFELKTFTGDSITAPTLRVLLSSSNYSSSGGVNPDSLPNNFYATFTSDDGISANLTEVVNNVDPANLLHHATTTVLPLTFDFWVAPSSWQCSINNITIDGGTHSWPTNSVSFYLSHRRRNGNPGTVTVDNFGINPQTSTYLSAVKNAPNLTNWDIFQTDITGDGTQNLFIRSSTNSISVTSSTPAWTSISPGSIPSISTGTFFQIRDDFSLIRATQSASLLDFTQNWFEGSATDKAYATYFKDAIWWSITYGAGATSNNRILKLDLINQAWLLYDIPINGFYIRQNNLYFGSATSGNVFIYGSSDNDNNSAINAYWKSKDFYGKFPFTDDDVTDLSTFFSSQNSTMTVTYTLVGSSSTAYSIPMNRTNATFGIYNKNLPLGTVGNTLNIKFGNNAADQPFEVFVLQAGLTAKSWKPGQ